MEWVLDKPCQSSSAGDWSSFAQSHRRDDWKAPVIQTVIMCGSDVSRGAPIDQISATLLPYPNLSILVNRISYPSFVLPGMWPVTVLGGRFRHSKEWNVFYERFRIIIGLRIDKVKLDAEVAEVADHRITIVKLKIFERFDAAAGWSLLVRNRTAKYSIRPS
jgi:hypothetical protein